MSRNGGLTVWFITFINLVIRRKTRKDGLITLWKSYNETKPQDNSQADIVKS